jgi:hypothetical protein
MILVQFVRHHLFGHNKYTTEIGPVPTDLVENHFGFSWRKFGFGWKDAQERSEQTRQEGSMGI